jgi:hypothetical protein
VSVCWNDRPAFSGVPIVSKYEPLTTRVGAVDPEFALLRERSRQGRGRRHRGILDGRLRLDALDHVEAELGCALRVQGRVGLLKVGRSLQAEHVREIEPRVDGVQLHQAAREEPRADQEHERRRELTDDERALRPAPAARAGGASAAGRHGGDRIVHEREPRRPREEQGHRRRDEEREHQHARVELDLAGAAGEPRGV